MKKIITIVLVSCLLIGCFACAIQAPPPSTVTMTSIESGNSDQIGIFGEKLFQEIHKTEVENPVISPFSAYIALSMAYNGAATETASAFADVMGLDLEQANELCVAFQQKLKNISGNTNLTLADSVWIDNDTAEVNNEYIECIKKYYGAEILEQDLQAKNTLEEVNSWISDKTNGHIRNMLNEIDQNTLFLLIDTIYMDAEWMTPFKKDNTYEDTFHTLDGDVTTDFMHASYYNFDYIDNDTYEGIILPYDDEQLAFVAVKPKNGNIMEPEFTGNTLNGWIQNRKTADNLIVSIPKFEKEHLTNLGNTLENLGLGIAFDQSTANFSKIGTSDSGKIFINQILQSTKIRLDEEGTEAAAATVEMVTESATIEKEPPIIINFDSPFLYAVVDLETNIPLFLGMLDNPLTE